MYSREPNKFRCCNKKGASKKNSYGCRIYESVDVRSLFWIVSHRFTENSIQDSKGCSDFNIYKHFKKERGTILFYYSILKELDSYTHTYTYVYTHTSMKMYYARDYMDA